MSRSPCIATQTSRSAASQRIPWTRRRYRSGAAAPLVSRCSCWDGRVDNSSRRRSSASSAILSHRTDPLVVAAHLRPVEIKEMVRDDDAAQALRTETVDSARQVYAEIERRVQADASLSAALIRAYGFARDDIRYLHVAESLAAFIRDRFQLHPTRLHQFVFDGGTLSEREIAGGVLFLRARSLLCVPQWSLLQRSCVPRDPVRPVRARPQKHRRRLRALQRHARPGRSQQVQDAATLQCDEDIALFAFGRAAWQNKDAEVELDTEIRIGRCLRHSRVAAS